MIETLIKHGFVYDMEDNIWYDENIKRVKYRLRVSIQQMADGNYKATLFNGSYNSYGNGILNNSTDLETAMQKLEIDHRDEQINEILT